jgi:hypothetical protein
LQCPFFNKFQLILETTHLPDCGTTENALNLDSKMIKKRQVEFIDIAMDPVETYVEDEDPTKFTSQKTGRGPLEEGWQKTCAPIMCAYKCVTVDVPYWGFGSRLEKFVSKVSVLTSALPLKCRKKFLVARSVDDMLVPDIPQIFS